MAAQILNHKSRKPCTPSDFDAFRKVTPKVSYVILYVGKEWLGWHVSGQLWERLAERSAN